MLSILASLNNHNIPKKTNRLSRHALQNQFIPPKIKLHLTDMT